MNRREFNTSLAALGALPTLPVVAPVAATTAPVVPAGIYAWARLIARAQNECSAEFLARHLRLSPDVAAEVFRTMIADGILKTPGATSIVQVAKPIDATGINRSIGKRVSAHILDALDKKTPIAEQACSDDAPLANSDNPCLGCDDTQTEDQTNASTDQSVQESPTRG
ncbi:MAG: hypothetical protein ACSHWS_09145 [Sulfitobacter sp.]